MFLVSIKNKETKEKIIRKKLEAVCANPNCSKVVYSEESRPHCIPIAGSTSVGKTAYVTAVTEILIEQQFKPKGCEVTFYSEEKEQSQKELSEQYLSGETTKTLEQNNKNVPSAFSVSYFVEHKSLRPKRLIHMFDIAGETFLNNAEHELQKHYAYSDGVILIIDPMSISDVAAQFEDKLNEVDLQAIGRDDPDDALSSLIAKMKQQAGLTESQKIDVPLAVVLNKVDEPGVCDAFSDEEKQKFQDPEKKQSLEYTNSLMCKAFFTNNSMGNFVNSVEVNFKTARYFACSAIGHSRGEGKYSPQGVLEPLSWIIGMTDKKLDNLITPSNENCIPSGTEEDETTVSESEGNNE